MTTRRTVLISILAAAVLAPAAGAQDAGQEGPRLAGQYEVLYKRKSYAPQSWAITPRCAAGACDSKLDGTDVDGTLRYLPGTKSYRIENTYKGGVCTRTDGETGRKEVVLKPSLRYSETITVDRFSGPAEAATSARGVIVARARPLEKAKRLGCKNSLRLRTKFTLTMR